MTTHIGTSGWTYRHWLGERDRREVFAYFNNDGHGHAVRNAWTLEQQLATLDQRQDR